VGTTQRSRELLPVMTLTELNGSMTAVITVWWRWRQRGMDCHAMKKPIASGIPSTLYDYCTHTPIKNNAG